MYWLVRCFRWQRLRTSSDTDTSAAKYGTVWGFTSNLSLKSPWEQISLIDCVNIQSSNNKFYELYN
ncbi:hypothetical protein DPMN_000877 [Dreissena polymorpha]|uniref:Uncharacterized protein n=1 Tax=Dreissena polymorpha TaxID=45954 RepID=A0A9D4MHH2_DREPO|nr:hypothetical protein DPMN_000877 [Dreissena polymorpha]